MSKYNYEMTANRLDSGKSSLIIGDFQDIQNTYNANQSNSISNEMIIQKGKCGVIYSSIILIFVILFIIVIIINLIKQDVSYIAVLIVSIVLLVFIFGLFLYLSLNTKHIKLIKNESLNLLTVKKINYLNFAKSKYYFNLDNVIPDIIKYQTSDEGIVYDNEALVITKTFYNNSEIDLNTSNIKNKPIKNLYYVFTGFKRDIYNSKLLRNFLGISPAIENPVSFNIYKYMGKSDNNPTFGTYNLSRLMKMSDYFYTYFLKVSCFYCGGIITPIIIALTAIVFLIVPIVTLFTAENVDILVSLIFIGFMFVIPFIIIIFNILAIKEHSLRIDIIYSENFDTIFIALLNHNGTSYKKIFMYSINTIERFVFENYEGYYEQSILKVVFKDKTVQDLLRIDESKFALEGLLFILNERLTNYQQCN